MQVGPAIPLRRLLAALAVAVTMATPFVAPRTASAAVPQSPPGWDRDVVLVNAQRWVDQRVPYSQTSWYRGYRQDCSGFVSMAWNIHASYPTGMMDQIASPIPKDALLPGDVLLNNHSSYAHVVLFARWAYTDKSWYWGYEQLSSTNRPVKRLIPYPYFRHQELYAPYRFTRFPPRPKPAPQPVSSKKPAPKSAILSVSTSTSPASGRMPSSPWLLQGLFVLMFVGAGGAAWHVSGRFLD